MAELPPRAGIPPHFDFDADALIAGIDLVSRSGARQVEFGWTRDDVPIEDADWYAFAAYRGSRITVEHHRGPVEAVEALARRLLRGGLCRRCGEPIQLSGPVVFRGSRAGCRWTRKGDRWEPGCDKPIDTSIPWHPRPAQ